jgi:hypothetical protein
MPGVSAGGGLLRLNHESGGTCAGDGGAAAAARVPCGGMQFDSWSSPDALPATAARDFAAKWRARLRGRDDAAGDAWPPLPGMPRVNATRCDDSPGRVCH